MKKLILLGVVAIVAALAAPAEAQISVNVNIGSRPYYEPVRYVNTGYYYSAPARPVYVNRVYKVKHSNWRPVKTRYVSRPVVYHRSYYENGRAPKWSHYNTRSNKHHSGFNKHGKSRGRR
jgi:hypothetical protein